MQDKVNETISGVSELKSTRARMEELGEVKIKLGEQQSNLNILVQEVNNLRRKQETDQEKALAAAQSAAASAAAAGKPDYKAITSVFSVLLSLILIASGLITWYVGGINDNLHKEILEAKSAASSAGGKYVSDFNLAESQISKLQGQVEDLQQRVPSQTEWMKADRTIEALRIEKIALLQRMTEAEGLIARSLLLVENESNARMAESSDINSRIDEHSRDLLALNTASSELKSALNGVVTEVEAQARGMMALNNVTVASLRQNIAMIWPRVFDGDSMPEIDYYNDNIPASANVSLGVNGK